MTTEIDTVFMLIECTIQLPQENSSPGIVCIQLQWKPLPVIIIDEIQLAQQCHGEAVAHAQTATS